LRRTGLNFRCWRGTGGDQTVAAETRAALLGFELNDRGDDWFNELDNAVQSDDDVADVRGPEVSIRQQVLTGHAGLTRSVWQQGR
jgi:hypothetical protein